MQVCTLLQTDNHASTSLLSFFTGRMPFLPPNQQCQSTEGNRDRESVQRKRTEAQKTQKRQHHPPPHNAITSVKQSRHKTHIYTQLEATSPKLALLLALQRAASHETRPALIPSQQRDSKIDRPAQLQCFHR